MPLKHLTETVLVVLLGILTILTGTLIDTLPLLPRGIVPWAIVFGVTLVYPLALYPFLRSNRADYFFRVLHFAPLMMVTLWLLIQLIALRIPSVLALHEWYTWGWTVAAVIFVFFLLEIFCFQVLRRRGPRLFLLSVLLVPFILFAFASERYSEWDQLASSALWTGDWWDITGSGTMLAGNGTGSKIALVGESGANLEPSDDPEEEAWRAKLRALDERLRSIKATGSVVGKTSSAPESSSSKPPLIARISSSSTKKASSSKTSSLKTSSSKTSRSSQTSSKAIVAEVRPPPTLPTSGPLLSSVVVILMAGYTGVLHQRAKKRLA